MFVEVREEPVIGLVPGMSINNDSRCCALFDLAFGIVSLVGGQQCDARHAKA
jgi:hypothetical protein